MTRRFISSVAGTMLKANKMPAGVRELAPDVDALDKIRITKKP